MIQSCLLDRKSRTPKKCLIDKLRVNNPEQEFLSQEPFYDGASFSNNHKMIEYGDTNTERYFEAPLV